MDYKKKYKDLFSRLKKVFDTTKSQEVIDMLYDNFREELYETEDERTRKEIIEFIQWCEDRGMTRHDFHQAKRPSEWIAYLEKQKEPKPAEWDEEDERMLSRCIKSVECSKQFANSETYKEAKDVEMNWLKSLPERFNLQPKQEWSKEDEEALKRAIDCVRSWEVDYCDGDNEISERLKSLTERFNLQVKNEWSENDKAFLKVAIAICNKYSHKDIADWLKSLRPQLKQNANDMITPNKKFFQWIYDRLVNVHKENPNVDYMLSFKKRIEELWFDEPHWKPSKEQMEALESAVKLYKETHFEMYHERIVSLYEELKKLM